MQAKLREKERAVELRQNGSSYSEILQEVHVAKSSLSLWLRSVDIKDTQRYKLRKSIIEIGKLGALAKRNQRIEKTKRIREEAFDEITQITNSELFYMGLMLYWAEGAKSRKTSISQCVDFSNSDPNMCKFFLKWLQISLKIPSERINVCVYIHESQKERTNEVSDYWSQITGLPKETIKKIYFTKTVYPRKSKRLDHGSYYGQLRLKVRKSTDLNRKIASWTEAICFRLVLD